MVRRRPCSLLLLVASALAAWTLPAAAEFGSTDFGLGRDVDVRLLHGYPVNAKSYYGPFTIGVQLRNRGAERSVHIAISGSVNIERSVHLPAHDQLRTFFYLPAHSAYYGDHAAVEVTDVATGRSKSVGADSKPIREQTVVRLGPISTALNVEKPWALFGALDAHLPDDWRGLAGIEVIVLEHAYALAHPPDWKVLMDWVAMGGMLLISTPPEALGEAAPWNVALPFAAPPIETPGGMVQRVGLGIVARALPEQLATIDRDFYRHMGISLNGGWSVSESELMPYATSNSARARLRDVHGPSWRLFTLLLAFAIAVGPGGWIAFISRRGRPLRYVAFAIGSAMVASLVVVSDDLIENGVRARCAASSALLIDQRVDTELGIEDVALYAPTRGGTHLRVPFAAQLLLSTSSDDNRSPVLVSTEADRMLVVGAVAVRQRRLVAARWLQPARKRLEVQANGDEIWVENQLGRDLSSLVVWRAAHAYRVAKLARGARARATPLSDEDVGKYRPAPPSTPAVSAAGGLVRSVIDGDFGPSRFAATYAWTPAQSTLIASDTLAAPGSDHVIAGVYE